MCPATLIQIRQRQDVFVVNRGPRHETDLTRVYTRGKWLVTLGRGEGIAEKGGHGVQNGDVSFRDWLGIIQIKCWNDTTIATALVKELNGQLPNPSAVLAPKE